MPDHLSIRDWGDRKYKLSGVIRGVRVRRIVSCETKLQAEHIRLRWLSQGHADHKRTPAHVETVTDLIAEYRKQVNPSLNVDVYLCRYERILGKVRLAQLRNDAIAQYVDQAYGDRSVKRSTVRRDLKQLKAVFAFALKADLMASCPKIDLPPELPPRKRALSEDVLTQFFEQARAVGPHVYLPSKFSYTTGARLGEIKQLLGNDLDETNRTVILTSSKGGQGERPRCVPLSAAAWQVVLEVRSEWGLGSTERVFRRADGKIWTHHSGQRGNALSGFKKALTGLPPFGFHALRHSFATRLARKGVDIERISLLLGHQSVETTRRYLWLDVSDLREAVEE